MLNPVQQVLWTDAEPSRLKRDIAEVTAFAPGLTYLPPDRRVDEFVLPHGGWKGVLPVWPFAREAPRGLNELVPEGLLFILEYPSAYPMVPPIIHPLRPEPEPIEMTQAAWHVLPAGGLCLLRSDGAWLPEASVTELLLKAAGWRIEYALMKAGVIEKMSVNGMVSSSELDGLVSATIPEGEP